MNGESSRYDKLERMLQDGCSEPHNLALQYLRNITNDFSDEQVLGEGGFGTVYKGVLENGKTIAVKKFNSSIPGVKDKQFENEANHLMRLKHPNIVLLVGWCSETENIYVEYNGKYIWAEKFERLICLEYMPKGNLRGYLSDACSGLGWDTRYKIIEGICYGLHYLHEQRQPIVHMDLKPANILLDNNMVPKIADFGLSRLFSEEKTWTRTISRDGTLGYMSPEYINRGLISTKADIFSLGVIIIEIVTGCRDYPDETGTSSDEFIVTVLNNWTRRRVEILFGNVSPEVDYQQIRRCIQIGLDCVKIDRSKRPTISQIIKTLHGPGSADSSNIKRVRSPANMYCNPSGLFAIAEETFTEFLSKATGTVIDWVQMPGMKPGPDSVGIVAISHGCRGIAARACGLVNLEPTKIIEILKDRPSWFRDCRSLEVFTMFPAGNGGTVELIYMQMYAPTTLVPARDFWTLRYTTTMEDGGLVVCERSLSGSGGSPNAASAQQFVRAEMLPSGYIVRPCDGGGSIVHIVDHLDLEAWSVPEVLRPLYESSRVVAQQMTIVALCHLRQIAQETSGQVVYAMGRQPAVLRTFSQRLSWGFNDAISGFNDDGWSVMGGDGIEDVVVACNLTKKAFGAPGGIICAKASMLLQSVPPAVLVRFLREHRSEWADLNIDAYLASSLETCSLPVQPMRFSGGQTIMPLAHTVENEEILEVVRLEGQPLTHDEALLLRDIHLLQLCTGIDEKSVGSSFQLMFAPIDEHFPDDAPLISSGFRVIPLDMKTDGVSSGRTLDLASSLDVGSAAPQASGDASPDDCNLRSVLTIAFQFPYEMRNQDSVATMARQYVRSVVCAVQRVSMAISPSQSGLNAGQRMLSGFPEAATLARWVCQSYHYHLGVELLNQSDEAGEALLKMLWHHPDVVLCCSFKEKPMFTFANKAGLDMLETSLIALQDLTLDKIFDESGRKAMFSDISKLMEQGYAYLPSGVCMSGMGRHVSFDQAVAWKVLGEDSNVHCLAFCFVNWSFV